VYKFQEYKFPNTTAKVSEYSRDQFCSIKNSSAEMLNSFAKKSKKIQWHLKAVLEEQDLSAKIDKAQQ